jgi:hypothetical protein
MHTDLHNNAHKIVKISQALPVSQLFRRIKVGSQPQANSSRDPALKIPNTKKDWLEWLKQ